MSSLSRRQALGLMAAVAVPPTVVVAVAAASPIEQEPLQHWLETSEPAQVAEYHAARLAEVMGLIDPERSWRFHIDHKHGFALVCGDSRPEGANV
ncbi:hypothetical protein [Pararhizobium sp. DWP1-1-3]|uniref:hypothetical protein n=1 Tax=Pararhizobium sp. DWP1-1-3 TaxID=2804652 RepID=UPI003CF02B71